ncbi:type II toxin-antitoxin system RelE/ParE family toxin [Phenylobacterium sp.]|uniref:type II toxin-antitoxin system RelE/ParE family toxin n=1 Tax=Phenylobacterium sp. TaxID=1871053 RepID=UPI003443509F
MRKVRWARSGSGKRGGARVIYFYHGASRPLYLLMVYAKAQQENLSPEGKRAVRVRRSCEGREIVGARGAIWASLRKI